MARLFLDANVLVSAALRPASAISGLWELDCDRLLGSPHVIAEARRNVNDPDACARLETLLAAVVVLPNEPADFEIEGDPPLPSKDRPVLLAAIVSGSDYLLTGDLSHFGPLMGTSVHGVRILLPGAYLRGHAAK